MKFRIRAFLFFALLLPVAASAQLSERLEPHFGFLYEQVNLTGVDDPNFFASYSFYSVHLGAYYMLAHKNDLMSVALDPSIQVGLRFNASDISWMVQAPIFLMGRLGAGATVYNQQKLGIGAGLGGVVHYMNMGGLIGFDPSTGAQQDFGFSEITFIPSVLFEGSLLTPGSSLTVRLHLTLFKPNGKGTVFGPGNTIDIMTTSYSLFGIGLIYGI